MVGTAAQTKAAWKQGQAAPTLALWAGCCPLTHKQCKLPLNVGVWRPTTWRLFTCAHCLWSSATNTYKSQEELVAAGQQAVVAMGQCWWKSGGCRVRLESHGDA